VSPNEILSALSRIWLSCADYPDADHAAILGHIENLQLLVFGLEAGDAQ
jgi:hypothetical protein